MLRLLRGGLGYAIHRLPSLAIYDFYLFWEVAKREFGAVFLPRLTSDPRLLGGHSGGAGLPVGAQITIDVRVAIDTPSTTGPQNKPASKTERAEKTIAPGKSGGGADSFLISH